MRIDRKLHKIVTIFGYIIAAPFLLFYGAIKIIIGLIVVAIEYGYKAYKAYKKKKETQIIKQQTQTQHNEQPKKEYHQEESLYKPKKLLTNCEKEYEQIIQRSIPEGYKLIPQVCLASIIEKTDKFAYANELFRIVDFGVFDENNNVKLLIEINDSSHNRSDRIARDYKVKAICEEANIPLVTFWVTANISEQYIKATIEEYL